jgi:hypothetical protein
MICEGPVTETWQSSRMHLCTPLGRLAEGQKRRGSREMSERSSPLFSSTLLTSLPCSDLTVMLFERRCSDLTVMLFERRYFGEGGRGRGRGRRGGRGTEEGGGTGDGGKKGKDGKDWGRRWVVGRWLFECYIQHDPPNTVHI